MAKKVAVALETETKVIKKILISQPKPESEKSPYFDLEKKHNVELIFLPFIKLEGIIAKEFRKQKIDITSFTAVVFTSRNAIDHFFSISVLLKPLHYICKNSYYIANEKYFTVQMVLTKACSML
jgi:uroporphyrinogen-III synthase